MSLSILDTLSYKIHRMLRLKTISRTIQHSIHNYNLFIREEDDYSDDEDGQKEDPTDTLKRQKRATWLYVSLLFGKETTRGGALLLTIAQNTKAKKTEIGKMNVARNTLRISRFGSGSLQS